MRYQAVVEKLMRSHERSEHENDNVMKVVAHILENFLDNVCGLNEEQKVDKSDDMAIGVVRYFGTFGRQYF